MTNIMYGITFYLFFGEEALQIKMIKLLKTKKRKKNKFEKPVLAKFMTTRRCIKGKIPPICQQIEPQCILFSQNGEQIHTFYKVRNPLRN